MRVDILLLTLLPLFANGASESLKDAGEKIYISMGCYGCHGVSGEGVNDFPRLAGRPAGYLAERLRELKMGSGYTPKKEMMVPYAKALDERQIEAVSAFLSSVGSHNPEELEVPEDILGGIN